MQIFIHHLTRWQLTLWCYWFCSAENMFVQKIVFLNSHRGKCQVFFFGGEFIELWELFKAKLHCSVVELPSCTEARLWSCVEVVARFHNADVAVTSRGRCDFSDMAACNLLCCLPSLSQVLHESSILVLCITQSVALTDKFMCYDILWDHMTPQRGRSTIFTRHYHSQFDGLVSVIQLCVTCWAALPKNYILDVRCEIVVAPLYKSHVQACWVQLSAF